jgi:hypothetical protein
MFRRLFRFRRTVTQELDSLWLMLQLVSLRVAALENASDPLVAQHDEENGLPDEEAGRFESEQT